MTEYQKEQQIIEWLQDYNSYKAGIENLSELIKDIAEEGMGIDYSKDNVCPTNKFNSVTENKVLKIDKFDISRKIKVMRNIVNSIDRALDSLEETEREIIINRCVKGQYYYQFCYKVCVSERGARRIKKEALRKMSIAVFGKE